MFKFVVLLSCVALAMGMVRRDAPESSDSAKILNDIQTHAAEFQKTFTDRLNAITNSKNAQEVKASLQKGSDDILKHLSAFSESLQNALGDANGKAKEALETTRTAIEKTAADLRKEHPEVEQQANKLKEKVQAAATDTAQNAQKLAKDIATNLDGVNEKLAPQLKKAFEDLTKELENVQKKIHEAATKQ